MMGRKEFLEKVVAIAGLSFVMFTFLGISGVEAQVERTVKVGWFTDLTGPLADSVGTQFPGAQDYF
jgi:hypothetical protein